jgi:hypothetical protein
MEALEQRNANAGGTQAYLDVLALIDAEGDEAATSPQAKEADDTSGRIGRHAGGVFCGRHALHSAPLADVVLGTVLQTHPPHHNEGQNAFCFVFLMQIPIPIQSSAEFRF